MQPSQILMALGGIGVAFAFVVSMEKDGDAKVTQNSTAEAAKEIEEKRQAVRSKGRVSERTKASYILAERPTGNFRSHRFNSKKGYSIAPPFMASGNEDIIWAADVISGYVPADYPNEAYFRSVHSIAPPSDCSFRTLAPGEKLANVMVGKPHGPALTLSMFSEIELLEETRGVASTLISKGELQSYLTDVPDQRIQSVNLVITDTSAPLYLVLQSTDKDVLWNIMAATGVEISHIAAIGNGHVVVAPPANDLDLDVEIIDTNLNECAPAPARKPADHWSSLRSQNSRTNDHGMLREFHSDFATYNTWFTGQFGHDAAWSQVGVERQAHLIFGPAPSVPEDRVPFAKLEGRLLLTSPEDYVLQGDWSEQVKFIRAEQYELIEMAFGGPIDTLRPLPREINQ